MRVLNLDTVSYTSRDRDISTMVSIYLRSKGHTVKEASLFFSAYNILTFKPDIIFMPCTKGAILNHDVAKLIKELNIPLISLVGEGNIYAAFENLDTRRQLFWGWNHDNLLYEDFRLVWNNKYKNLVSEVLPKEVSERIIVSGAVGFDRYQVLKSNKVENFLSNYNVSKFDKIVGIGCWDFGFFLPEDSRFVETKECFTREEMDFFISQRDVFEKLLYETIKKCPQHLFILREHPAVELGRWASGIQNIEEDFDNVIVIKKELSLFDNINLCDLWLVYESTTALEAWLLGKRTGLINGTGRDFKRELIAEGSPHFETPESLADFINDNDDNIHFMDRESNRRQIIEDIVSNDDGYNHVRTGVFIECAQEKLKNNNTKYISKSLIKRLISEQIKLLLSFLPFKTKRISYYKRMISQFTKSSLEKTTNIYKDAQHNFYNSNSSTLKSIEDRSRENFNKVIQENIR